jgi:hypothetical protein
MSKLVFEFESKNLSEQDQHLIELCVQSIVSGRLDQLKLILADIDSAKKVIPINKVHDALYKNTPAENKTIWDREIEFLNKVENWVNTVFLTAISEKERKLISAAEITKSSNIASLGSCFATNISKHLKKLEYTNTYTLRVEEAVNSPRLIDMYFNPQRVPFEQKAIWDNRFGVESKYIIEVIPKINLFILTFGVGWDLIDENNNICLDLNSLQARLASGELKFHNPTPYEQSEYISSCIKSIRKLNLTAPILVTLSPVPLSGFFGSTHVFRANAISKSSLVLAIELAKSHSEFIYVPTYEVVTSLAPILFKENIWGEDGTSRHPNNNLIRMICESFAKLL